LSPATIVEAEVVRVAWEILHAFNLHPCPRVALSHPSLQSALFDLCAVSSDEAKRAQLRTELNKVAGGRREWPAIAARLRKWCDADAVQCLEKYVCIQWKPVALPKLLALLRGRLPVGRARDGALAAVAGLQATCTAAAAMGVPGELLVVDARLSLSETEFPSGLQIQVAAPQHSVLMRGGRFDDLLQATGGERRVACGLTIGTKRLLEASVEASADGRGAGAGRPVTELEVCVCSPAEAAGARMELVGALWREGVKADLSHEGDLGSQMAHAAMLGVAVVATISASGDSVVIKQLRRKDELPGPVPRDEAVKHIKQVLHAQSSRSIGRVKPRQGNVSPPPERRAAPEHHVAGSSSATALKVSL
jgi:histidyl-tRNA synthetase